MPNESCHPATLDVETLLHQCDVVRTRGSGPGGQHRNKVETAIVITHRPTQIIGQASERRSQADNRKEAITRLRINLAISFRMPVELTEKVPSELWLSRLKARRIEISLSHEDFPAILAEALDFLAATEFDANDASEKLHCTSSQLIKLLRKEPAAFQMVNQKRVALGLKSYR